MTLREVIDHLVEFAATYPAAETATVVGFDHVADLVYAHGVVYAPHDVDDDDGDEPPDDGPADGDV